MTSLSTFTDIIPVLDAAVRAEGAILSHASPADAIRWRARANACRVAYRAHETAKWKNVPGKIITSPWDALSLSVKDCDVIMTLRKPVGELRDLDGNPLTTDNAPLLDGMNEDELEKAAKSFAAGLKL